MHWPCCVFLFILASALFPQNAELWQPVDYMRQQLRVALQKLRNFSECSNSLNMGLLSSNYYKFSIQNEIESYSLCFWS